MELLCPQNLGNSHQLVVVIMAVEEWLLTVDLEGKGGNGVRKERGGREGWRQKRKSMKGMRNRTLEDYW